MRTGWIIYIQKILSETYSQEITTFPFTHNTIGVERPPKQEVPTSRFQIPKPVLIFTGLTIIAIDIITVPSGEGASGLALLKMAY